MHNLLTDLVPWSSGYSGSDMAQRVSVKREFEAGFRHAPIGKLFLS